MSNKKKSKKQVKTKNRMSPAVWAAVAIAVLALAGIVVGIVFLSKGQSGSTSQPESSAAAESSETPAYAETSFEKNDAYKYVQIEMEDGGKIVLELYPDIAPITVDNFVGLAKNGFYDGLIFHRVISGFMIQGGDPQGTGYGGSGRTIKGEFSANGVENNLSHKRGVISMARSKNSYDSASSQFFICHNDAAAASCDGLYAAFGRVVSGMDVVDKIASVKTNANDKPLTDQVMKKVTVLE